MSGFLTASQNLPFTVALAVMFGIALLEGITTVLGAGISGFLDALLPDFDLDAADPVSGASEVPAVTPLSRLLGWLRIGQVPILILLVIFLTAFGLIGLSLQSFVHNLTGQLLPGLVASILALVPSLPAVRVLGGLLGRIMPRDETDAIAIKTLVGRIAVITLGTARKGSPAEARVRDQYGTTHYIMVEPDQDGLAFRQGESVLLVRQDGSIFKAIENPNPALVDE